MGCFREIMAKKIDVEYEPFGGVQPNKVPERSVEGKPTIYTYATCPFSLKVKSLLKSRNIEFSNVEVDPTFENSIFLDFNNDLTFNENGHVA